MKKLSMVFLLLMLVFTLAACTQLISISSRNTKSLAGDSANASHPGTEWTTESTEQINSFNENKAGAEEQMEQKKELILSVNGNKLNVSWENNDTVNELIDHVQNENIVVDTTLYGGFEQVGSLPRFFSRNDVQMTTVPGDIVLYSGNQLVVFFGSNSWSYTKLGHINLSVEELAELLNSNTVFIEISGV